MDDRKTMFDRRTFAAFLFDMDGTLLNSITAATRVWTQWAEAHGIEPESVLSIMHGVRTIETLRKLDLPDLDIEHEAAWLARAEAEDVDGVVEINGARRFLHVLPENRWAIVTSAPRSLAKARLQAAGLPMPPVLVTADDVERGKPAPDPFMRAAAMLSVPIADCLVWEDAASGVAAAEAAGTSIAVITSAHATPLDTCHTKFEDYTRVQVAIEADGRLALLGATPG